MGAEWFETEISKKEAATAVDAFKIAVERAQYDHGHSGYTGTIAEKYNFVMIQPHEVEYGNPKIDDKWGPAGCIEYPDRWVFVGWASS